HDLFHLVGEDLEARHDDHVLLAVEQLHEALRIDHADVARLQPAVVGERVPGFLGTAPIALHDLRAAHPHLAGLADGEAPAALVAHGHVGAGYREADGPDLGLRYRID